MWNDYEMERKRVADCLENLSLTMSMREDRELMDEAVAWLRMPMTALGRFQAGVALPGDSLDDYV